MTRVDGGPRRRPAFVACIALTILAPALLWYSAVGNPMNYLDPSVPDGQLLYVLSKLAGLCAIALLALQLSLTLLRGTRAGRALAHRSVASHIGLGALVTFACLIHVAAFVGAASLRSGHFAGQLLLPRWNSGFYDAMVSLGALGFALLLVAVAAGSLSRRRAWIAARHPAAIRRAHRASILVFVPLVLVHSYAIGSETATPPGVAFYLVVGALSTIGLWHGLRGRLPGFARRGGSGSPR